jgi:gas vesicle protein
MSIWTLIQIVFDLFMVVGMASMAFRLRRPPQDDPRLSRGLQLLQTKITVLEDLSDRTDAQVKQLSSLLDQKTRVLQNKVIEAEHQIVKIDHSMNKSIEVAEIFQDKIPHEEILERQRTVEYVKAARMAHSGLAVEDICAQVNLPREQVELIAKFNREQLMFDETALPEWAAKATEQIAPPPKKANFGLGEVDFVSNQEKPQPDFDSITRLGEDFKSAIEIVKKQDIAANASLMDSKVAETLKASVMSGMETMQPAVMSIKATAQTLKDRIVATAEDMLRSANEAARVQQVSEESLHGFATPTTPLPSFTESSAASAEEPMGITLPARPTSSPSAGANAYAANKSAGNAGAASPVRANSALVKKVIFPRIEK